ncbi:hypothetical protein A28LD_0336 [Idiomarina sp. A28L]|nr:hypothetical protein A28LD_0336 [Idiomarina sp. A28L]
MICSTKRLMFLANLVHTESQPNFYCYLSVYVFNEAKTASENVRQAH